MASEGYPKAFGNYVLLESFAHGGMGEVYLAKHGAIAGIDRMCVLKKLRPDFTQNEEYVNRFVDEARLVVQLTHANIAHVFDFGRAGEEYYLAMEFVSGVTIRAIQNRSLEKNMPIPEGVALYILSEALEALDYAHRLKSTVNQQPLKLVHRDVSPQNVMASFEGEVKLIDFGLAASALKEEQTESQVVMGKVAYMSPEQARGDPVVSATDQFALAICAYELFAQERFYNTKNNYEIWQVVGRGGFVPERWRTLNPELAGILAKALSGDIPNRFDTCGDFSDALTAYRAKYHPLVNQRSVRKYLANIFAEDIAQDNKRMAEYAGISVNDVHEGGETRADTVSLVNPLLEAGIDPNELTEASSSKSGDVFSASKEGQAQKRQAEGARLDRSADQDFVERDTVVRMPAQSLDEKEKAKAAANSLTSLEGQAEHQKKNRSSTINAAKLNAKEAAAVLPAYVDPPEVSESGLSSAFFRDESNNDQVSEKTNVVRRAAMEPEKTSRLTPILVGAVVVLAVAAILVWFLRPDAPPPVESGGVVLEARKDPVQPPKDPLNQKRQIDEAKAIADAKESAAQKAADAERAAAAQEALKKDPAQDIVKKDVAEKDLAKKDLAKKDVAEKDLAKKDVAKKDVAKKDVVQKDVVKKDVVKKDVVKKDVVKKDVVKKDDTSEFEPKRWSKRKAILEKCSLPCAGIFLSRDMATIKLNVMRDSIGRCVADCSKSGLK